MTNTTKMTWSEIEREIEKLIAELGEWTDLNDEDIAQLRSETYKEHGWDADPFPDSTAGIDDEDDEPYAATTTEKLHEVGMRWADFF